MHGLASLKPDSAADRKPTASAEPAGRGPAPQQSPASAALALSSAPTMIQRACAGCGGGSSMEDEEPKGGGVIQRSIEVSSPGDPQEIEADRVADQVMRMPG